MESELKMAKEIVYDQCGFKLTSLNVNHECQVYEACEFKLDEMKILYRVSKITPTKTGQFVSIWKRNQRGITEPFDLENDFDFILITSRNADNFGQFIFPKLVLANEGIITQNGKQGKRGIRVYPPWDHATNKQAQKTQSWQTKYFLTIKDDNTTDLNFAKKLFSSKD